MEHEFVIGDYLLADNQVFIIQDGCEMTVGQVRAQAAELEQVVRNRGWRRVALLVSRTDTMIAALAACQKCACDLLLLREDYPKTSAIWSACQVEAVLGDNLEVIRSYPNSPPEHGGFVLLATSGTTGQPKVAVHTIAALASRIIEAKALAESARWLLTFHPASFAGLQVILTVIVSGSKLVAISSQSVTALAEAARSFRTTHISGTPTFWRSFLVAVSRFEREMRIQQITIGGEAVDQGTLDHLSALFPEARLTHIYASTEAGAIFAVRDRRAGFPAAWLDSGVEGTRLRIRDQVLEILSPRPMRGYLGTHSQRNLTDDGWLVSGDVVEPVGDRVLFRGRGDNVINVGGAKVMPEEVEEVLLRHPHVREAHVYGQRNPMVGAIVCADLVLTHEMDAEIARRSIYVHAAEQLENHKLPRIVRFVPIIFTNAAGKKVRSHEQ